MYVRTWIYLLYSIFIFVCACEISSFLYSIQVQIHQFLVYIFHWVSVSEYVRNHPSVCVWISVLVFAFKIFRLSIENQLPPNGDICINVTRSMILSFDLNWMELNWIELMWRTLMSVSGRLSSVNFTSVRVLQARHEYAIRIIFN